MTKKVPKLPKQICVLADSNNKRGYVNSVYLNVDSCRPYYIGTEKFIGVYELKKIVRVGSHQTTEAIKS